MNSVGLIQIPIKGNEEEGKDTHWLQLRVDMRYRSSASLNIRHHLSAYFCYQIYCPLSMTIVVWVGGQCCIFKESLPTHFSKTSKQSCEALGTHSVCWLLLEFRILNTLQDQGQSEIWLKQLLKFDAYLPASGAYFKVLLYCFTSTVYSR